MDATSQSARSVEKIVLDQEWSFRQNGADQTWRPVYLPSSVHTALMQHKIIENPFYRDNEEKYQWIETKDWEYETTFDVKPSLFEKQHIEMQFAGLDTYAQVFLNDTLILEANNMFRSWRVDVKKWLKPTANVLHIYFESPVNKPKAEWDALGYVLPGGIRTMTRKAQYHYGWDWGPKLTGCGIYQKPELIGWDDFILDDFRVTMRTYTPEKATMVARFKYRSTVAETMFTQIRHSKTKEVAEFYVQQGTHEDSVLFDIHNPELWWCRGMGEPHLYDIKLEVKRASQFMDASHTRTGLRWTELVRETDAKGTTFYVKLNGKPVFCKGANYIPLEVFNDVPTEQHYKKMLQNAAEANMNMLRVWGGGVYEQETFYDLCDEMGIMVWQDFMYACAMYPGSGSFLKNAAAEAMEQVLRLRKHPSIVLWCGNNENNEAWHNWGWQMNFTEEQRARLWSHYKLMFMDILPTYVNNYGDGVPYWESSPSYGRFNPKSLTEGDSHDWGVWHDEAPFSRYETHVPRFMSEYGFQSFPNWSTIERFTLPDERYLESKVMLLHQKHPKGNQLIDKYMRRSYRVPKDFKQFVYVSQVQQAEGMRTAIEAHRRNKPYCMGSLYWQLNDVWPVASWSGIDYYGNWKALHYYARSAFAQVAAIPELKDGKLNVYLVADAHDTITTNLSIRGLAFDGDEVFSVQLPSQNVTNDSARLVWGADLKALLRGKKRETVCAYIALHDPITKREIYRRVFYFAEPKDMKLPQSKPEISFKPGASPTQWVAELKSDRLIRSVYVHLPKAIKYSDNFFDLLPREPKTITIEFSEPVSKPEPELEILSLNSLY